MAAAMTPSQLLEIRRVRAMASSAADTPQNQCFKGEKGDTGQQGPPGERGNFGVPASLGYFNESAFPQLIPNNIPTIVTWANVDTTFSQGVTGIGYSQGRFFNSSTTDDILLNVSGFISFFQNTSGNRSVYGRLNGINANIYGYAQVSAVSNSDTPTIVPFAFNIFLKSSTGAFNYFEILVNQTATVTGNALSINNATSRISMTRINTSIKGDTGPSGLTTAQINTQIQNTLTTVGINSILTNLLTPYSPKTFGNILIVDSVFGTGNLNSLYQTFQTIESAIANINASPSSKTIWLLPGTYNLVGNNVVGTGNVGISIPIGCSIRGMSAQSVIIRMTVTTNTTMILMGENTMIEDCTIELTATSTCDLTGILFSGTSTFTSKIKGCILTINNNTVTPSTNIIGILANGIGAANTSTTSFALDQAKTGSLSCIEDLNIYIISNYNGIKRGILVGGGSLTTTNIVNIRNTNIFIKNPLISSGNAYSYYAIDNNSATSKIQCFNSIIAGPTTGPTDDFSDISQTFGEVVIAEGTTLLNKRSRIRTPGSLSSSYYPFKLLTNTRPFFYSALGKINNFIANVDGYLLPGTMMIQNYPYPPAPAATVYNFQYPSTNIPSTCYIVPNKSILMSARVRLGKQQSATASGTTPPTFQLSVTVYNDRTPLISQSSTPRLLFTLLLNDTDTEQVYPNSSNTDVFTLEEGSQLRVSMKYTTINGNLGEDLYVQLELY